MRLVFLDSGPLGLLTNPRGRPKSDQCRQWVKNLAAAGVRVFVPEIADYEGRNPVSVHFFGGVIRWGVIRRRGVFSGKNDEPTQDFRHRISLPWISLPPYPLTEWVPDTLPA